MWFVWVLGLLALFAVGCAIWSQGSQQNDRRFAGTVTGRSSRATTLTTGMRQDNLLTVCGDDGTEFTLRVSRAVYDSFAVGDPIVKRAGTPNPVKGTR